MNLGTFIDKLESIEDTDGFCNGEVYFTSVDEKPCLIIQGRDDMYCFNLLELNEDKDVDETVVDYKGDIVGVYYR